VKALSQDRYGPPDVLTLEEVADPAVGGHDVLIRVAAVGLNAADWHLVRGTPYLVRAAYGLRRPRQRVPGSDVAGVVAAVGEQVTGVQVGDRVMSEVDRGGLAELVCVEEQYVAPVPERFTFEQAAVLPLAGLTALHAVRDAGKVQAGQKVLVNGASGGVGHFAVQIARHLGAQVTGVCSTANVELVGGLGAQHVVDYTVEDPFDGSVRYDVVLDLIANHPLRRVRSALEPRGRYAAIGSGTGCAGHQGRLVGPAWTTMRVALVSPFVSQTLVPVVSKRNRDDLLLLARMAQAGDLHPHIERVYPLADAPTALARLEQGHVAGKLVVTI
jgi:NADPH:quinone reductase-like Zn-dependent oxidoreductase